MSIQTKQSGLTMKVLFLDTPIINKQRGAEMTGGKKN